MAAWRCHGNRDAKLETVLIAKVSEYPRGMKPPGETSHIAGKVLTHLAARCSVRFDKEPSGFLQRQDEDHQLRQKTLANPDKNHFLAKARRNSFLTTMPISSTFWCHKRNEINIRQTLGIDIRKEPSRNETTGLDEIREGHRKEIRTIQPTLDT
ncbi:hypothetical protein HGM15179_005938 [Zosterops borbonicus]|uniref:Uncharacterized protein n=1 Tax=Zosterops borbonicus TaxID=364589 RepID=A0A8K1GMB6_9PASS|nr:hypothetical protein HGM15179_005938 [Zosterops borbonicus]